MSTNKIIDRMVNYCVECGSVTFTVVDYVENTDDDTEVLTLKCKECGTKYIIEGDIGDAEKAFSVIQQQ